MIPYALTQAAEADLQGIAAYIALDDSALADRVLDALDESMRRLAEFPGIGHTRRDLDLEELRVWVTLSYLIVYVPKSRPLKIVRVLHGARDRSHELGQTPSSKRRRRGRR